LLSAQKTVRLQDLSLAKESVSATKQTYISGDTSAAAMGQSSDTEAEVFLPEGVTASAIDKGMDPSIFRDNADYVVESAASNHGIPPSVLHQRDASSGAEIQLRRIPIRELRKERIPTMRRIEMRIAKVISVVNGTPRLTLDEHGQEVLVSDLPDYAFSVDGWSIDFGEIQQPLTEAERDQVFEKRRQLGLTDNYEEERVRNPDIKTYAEAKQIVDERIERQTEFVQAQKELMALNGSLNTATGETTAQENGRAGAAAAAEKRPPDNLKSIGGQA
jgi:hypothetical protein